MAEKIKTLSTLFQAEFHKTKAVSESSEDTHNILAVKLNVKSLLGIISGFLIPRIIDIFAGRFI